MSMFRGTKALECFTQSLLIGTAVLCGPWPALAQMQQEQPAKGVVAPATQEQEASSKAQGPEVTTTDPVLKKDNSDPVLQKDNSEGKQPKRILGIIPNYRSVSANTQLPRLAVKDKFWLATQDSFDYSSFIVAGVLAGIAQANNSTPEFGQGGRGFGRYYWHSLADQAVGNYFTEAIVPTAVRQDPRYYTLGHGGFFRRMSYAVSRLLITRTDSGGSAFNVSEIIGNGAGAGVSDLYAPGRERTWTKTGQKWLTQVALDGVFNLLKEFWPDIDRAVFRGHYGSRRSD